MVRGAVHGSQAVGFIIPRSMAEEDGPGDKPGTVIGGPVQPGGGFPSINVRAGPENKTHIRREE